jgi:hypothetical protein
MLCGPFVSNLQSFILVMVSLPTIVSRLALLLNAAADSGAWPAEVGGNGRFPLPEEIERVILLRDFDVRRIVQETPGHPQRVAPHVHSAELAHGAKLPAMTGLPGLVEIKSAAGAWATGAQAESRQQIEEARLYPVLFGGESQIDGFYLLEDGRVYHTGAAARVSYVLLTVTAECQAAEEFEDAVLWGAAATLFKDGGDVALHQFYLRLWENETRRIRALGGREPASEQGERLAAA